MDIEFSNEDEEKKDSESGSLTRASASEAVKDLTEARK